VRAAGAGGVRQGGAGIFFENRGASGGGGGPAPGQRLGGWGIRWQIGWLEAVNRDGVGFVADLKLEGEWSAAKDLEGACVRGGEWWVGGGGANENERGGEELGW
jgi:hypothetical protein